jgi:hypothetical protein
MRTAKDIRRAHNASKLVWKIWTLVVVFGLCAFAFMLGYFPFRAGCYIVEKELDHAGRAINRVNTAYTSVRDGVKNFGKATTNLANMNDETKIPVGSMIKAKNAYVIIDDNGNATLYKKGGK